MIFDNQILVRARFADENEMSEFLEAIQPWIYNVVRPGHTDPGWRRRHKSRKRSIVKSVIPLNEWLSTKEAYGLARRSGYRYSYRCFSRDVTELAVEGEIKTKIIHSKGVQRLWSK